MNRFQLSDFGLSGEEIDRVYRSIFVYSRGFASIMNDILAHHHEHGKNIVEKLWNLYSRVIDESNPINGVGYIQRIKGDIFYFNEVYVCLIVFKEFLHNIYFLESVLFDKNHKEISS